MHTLWWPSMLAGQEPAQQAQDVMSLVLIGGFSLFFVVLAFSFLRKKRRERIEALTEGSNAADAEHGLQDYVDGKRLPEHTETEATKAPKANELMAAEKEALSAKAEEERAKRERERLEKQQAEAVEQAAADADAAAAAAEREAKLEAAKEAEREAAATREKAEAKAKKLRSALQKTRDGFVGRLSKVLGGKEIDPNILAANIRADPGRDIGARTAGGFVRFETAVVASVDVGGRAVENVRVAICDDCTAELASGLLGLDVQRPLGLALDVRRHVVRFGDCE